MVTKLAEHAIALSLKYGKEVTVVPLSRVLFFAIGITIKQGEPEHVTYIKENYKDDFERWRYGAVPPEVYYRYNHYGYRKLTRGGRYHKELEFFNRILLVLMDASPDKMSAVNRKMRSHRMWESRIEAGLDVPRWTFEEIQFEFSQLKGRI